VPLTGRYGGAAAQGAGRLRDRGRARERRGGVAWAARRCPSSSRCWTTSRTPPRREPPRDAGRPGRRRLSRRVRLRPARGRRVGREKNKTRTSASPSRFHRSTSRASANFSRPSWKSPRHPPGHRGSPRLDPRRRASEDRGDLQEKTTGAEMATRGPRPGKGAGYEVVVTPSTRRRQGLLRSHPEGQERQRRRRVRTADTPDGMTIVKQMKELGYNPKLTMLIRSADPPVGRRTSARTVDYVVLGPGWHHAIRAPGVKELNEAHEKKIAAPRSDRGPRLACVQILATRSAGQLARPRPDP